MPIDPSIPLGVRPVQIANPLEMAQSAIGLRTQVESQRALQEQREASAEQRRLQAEALRLQQQQSDALRRLPPDQWTLEGLGPILGPKGAADVIKALDDMRMASFKTENEVRASFLNRIAGVSALPEPMRAEAWDLALTDYARRGVLDPKQIGAYSPEKLAQFNRELMTPEQRASADKPIEVSPGASLMTPGGQVLATAPKPEEHSASYREWLDAKREGYKGSFTQYQNEDANRKRSVTNINQPRPLTMTAESNLINKLSAQWTKATDQRRELNRQLGIMRTGLQRFDADPNGASQAVLVTFQKILDPESVVRESEYARSAHGLSQIQRIAGWAEKLTRGGAGVPKAQLAEMVRTAELFVRNTSDGPERIRRRIGANAARYNIPEELVFDDAPTSDGPSNAAAPPARGNVLMVAPDGRRLSVPPGDVARLEKLGAKRAQ